MSKTVESGPEIKPLTIAAVSTGGAFAGTLIFVRKAGNSESCKPGINSDSSDSETLSVQEQISQCQHALTTSAFEGAIIGGGTTAAITTLGVIAFTNYKKLRRRYLS